MPLQQISYQLTSTNRSAIRNEMIQLFLNEQPGTGKGSLSSKYHYNVDSFRGTDIVIKRPAALNKGFDFTVNTNTFLFKKKRRYKNPSHQDVLDSLLYCKSNYPNSYSVVKNLLNSIYHCNQTTVPNTNIGFFMDYNNNLQPIQVVILITKWLFIEQDVTYWNWSGRKMFYDKLQSSNLI